MLLDGCQFLCFRMGFLGDGCRIWEDLRPTIKNVAKGATPRRAILSLVGEDVSRLVWYVSVAT